MAEIYYMYANYLAEKLRYLHCSLLPDGKSKHPRVRLHELEV